MNRDTHEEYEEVESPFAPQSNRTTTTRSSLRNKKAVFNRPFAAESSTPPAVFETTSRRKAVAHPDETDLIQHRSSELAEADIDYLDGDEEEEVETRPAKVTPRAAKKPKVRKNILAKIGWAVIGLLVLRLICMDRGVWDYFATEGSIREKKNELKTIQEENKSLRTEIVKIQSDRNYQRQLAKEHLGVIAADEFLILFAGETPDSPDVKPNTSL